MAIRDRFSRMLRKSISSSSSTDCSEDSHQRDIATTATTATNTIDAPTPIATPLSKATSRLAKMKSWRSSGGSSSTSCYSHQKSDGISSYNWSCSATTTTITTPSLPSPQPPTRKPNKSSLKQARLHPSERPLTEQNLRHQEMLGAFTMKFGRTRGLSSGNSRADSLDLGGGGVAPDEVI
ncbi:hypothetical protein M406DRAFT_349268 [Cryphonectria parasitica EP155]|uniref:Uncharacterized protein n=1 Tax=Cryphonectria parasitica (strain ATCC 38755 / EP155) TaxID=660469 RepID=A0A9P4YCT1_CRYP1|nr:uncharacterized protein M406DRAFT_349268 [Cryphonectria parasitica EP155]KAF3770517.1 hypothetical protein M406DRAFT_349268 [Cryphonectria parasitica EP155]